eukprot:COSAG01_NODE_809_length_13431_cov_12.268677_4_plen_295_part_00
MLLYTAKSMDTSFTNAEIEEYATRFKELMDLKRERYSQKEHQQCKNNFTAKMKQYNQRDSYNQSFDLFCLAVYYKKVSVSIAKQREDLKQELEQMKHNNRANFHKMNEYKAKYEALAPPPPPKTGQHMYKCEKPELEVEPAPDPIVRVPQPAPEPDPIVHVPQPAPTPQPQREPEPDPIAVLLAEPEPEPQADGIRLVDHWGSDEADELRECLRYHARNILDRAQKLAKLKELTDEDSMDMSNKLYDVAEELADSLKVQFSESVEKQIVEKQVDLLEADISALYEQQADDLPEP